ncbi:MAG: hypothetical protein D6733_00650 [Methanobacteriota archaeon]|nr:MAG: hypothetical protein D6733_00650 [Euryarchaeota archaeon]
MGSKTLHLLLLSLFIVATIILWASSDMSWEKQYNSPSLSTGWGGVCNGTDLLYSEALRMKPPEDIQGVKRNAYALLHDVNMYAATGEEEYLRLADAHGTYLLDRQLEDGGWREVEGEVTSSYALLETVTATWALSEAYVRGVLTDRDVEEAVIRGGDALVGKARYLTLFGYRIGLKPNAVGFLVIGLVKAGEAAERMGEHERAVMYRSKAVEVGHGLVSMQRGDGAWYDGPYRLPLLYGGWRDISAWYQGMALSGVSAAYSVSPPDKAPLFRESAVYGLAFYSSMKRPDGGYYGVLHPDGRADGKGDVMVLQAHAISGGYGLPSGCDALGRAASEVRGWDANYAYAVSQLLLNQAGEKKIN